MHLRSGRPVSDPDRARRSASLVVLAIAAASFVATSQSGTSLTSNVIGQVEVGAGNEVVLPITIRIEPEAGRELRSGSLSVGLETTDGTQSGYVLDVATTVQDASGVPIGDDVPSLYRRVELPIEGCATGCAFDYRLVFTSLDAAAPPALLRFFARADLGYDYCCQPPPAGALQVAVAGAGPAINAQWLAAVAAIVGLIVGVIAGRRVAWSGRRRYVPGVTLGVLLLAAGFWAFLEPFTWAAPRLWDVVPLLGLGIGLLWSVRRWVHGDTGWLAVASMAVVAIGGIVFLGRVGLLTGYRPVELIVVSLVGWSLVGVVVAQGWRIRDPASRLSPGWTTIAVVSQSIILVGLTGSALSPVFDAYLPSQIPYTTLAVPALIAMPLVVWGWRRWIAGKRSLMAVVNVLLFLIGAVGLWGLTLISGWNQSASVTWGPVAFISLGSCVFGLLAALHAPPKPTPAEPPPAEPVTSQPPPPPPPDSLDRPPATA